jgi:hypothetical protein
MAYLQFTRPVKPGRLALVSGIIEEAHFWAKERNINLEHDIAGFELNLHFSKPEDMTLFMLSEYSKWFKVID